MNQNLVAILQVLVTRQLYVRKTHTHSISQRAVTCLSTTCLSFTGSPSNCCRSPSPNREPRPIICLFLWNTGLHVTVNSLTRQFTRVSLWSLFYLNRAVTHYLRECTCSPGSGPGCPAAPAAAALTEVLWCPPEHEVDFLKGRWTQQNVRYLQLLDTFI